MKALAIQVQKLAFSFLKISIKLPKYVSSRAAGDLSGGVAISKLTLGLLRAAHLPTPRTVSLWPVLPGNLR
jgi:hypothetical protein